MLTHWSQLVPNNYVNRHPRTLSNTTAAASLFPQCPAEAGCLFVVAAGVHLRGEPVSIFLWLVLLFLIDVCL